MKIICITIGLMTGLGLGSGMQKAEADTSTFLLQEYDRISYEGTAQAVAGGPAVADSQNKLSFMVTADQFIISFTVPQTFEGGIGDSIERFIIYKDNDAAFTSYSLDAATDVPGYLSSFISAPDGFELEVKLGGIAVNTGEQIVLNYSPASPVPEPATLALAGLGGVSLLALRRKK